MFQIRQGDVLVSQVESIPEGATVVPADRGRVILAYGEVTGHAHQIAEPVVVGAELLSVSGQVDRYLRMRSGGRLVHEEHSEIAVPAGTYRVRIQVEWSDALEPRQVVD
jgi:hypothetical protein